mmetsp:Transcript_123684/g.231394  ORF Transcript_123684/g.231394 Transcript_123684/m.231394 type:complete len:222 (+) Transcript_123684:737-1402(+)
MFTMRADISFMQCREFCPPRFLSMFGPAYPGETLAITIRPCPRQPYFPIRIRHVRGLQWSGMVLVADNCSVLRDIAVNRFKNIYIPFCWPVHAKVQKSNTMQAIWPEPKQFMRPQSVSTIHNFVSAFHYVELGLSPRPTIVVVHVIQRCPGFLPHACKYLFRRRTRYLCNRHHHASVKLHPHSRNCVSRLMPNQGEAIACKTERRADVRTTGRRRSYHIGE